MNERSVQDRLELAVDAGCEAGRTTLEHFGRADLQVERKSDASPVTVADRRAEEYLRARITAAFPDDGIFGEEFPETQGTSGYRWIVDPIDGTQSFIHAVPLYGTLVGVEHEGQCVIGVIVMPALDEYVYAAVGQGAWYVRENDSPRRAAVSAVEKVSEAMLVTTSFKLFEETGKREPFERLSAAVRVDRYWGDCYGYLLVATGRADVMVDPVVSPWDVAAVKPILEEAGGSFTDWRGNRTIYAGEGIGTNGHILDEVIALTGDANEERRT